MFCWERERENEKEGSSCQVSTIHFLQYIPRLTLGLWKSLSTPVFSITGTDVLEPKCWEWEETEPMLLGSQVLVNIAFATKATESSPVCYNVTLRIIRIKTCLVTKRKTGIFIFASSVKCQVTFICIIQIFKSRAPKQLCINKQKINGINVIKCSNYEIMSIVAVNQLYRGHYSTPFSSMFNQFSSIIISSVIIQLNSVQILFTENEFILWYQLSRCLF